MKRKLTNLLVILAMYRQGQPGYLNATERGNCAEEEKGEEETRVSGCNFREGRKRRD